MLHGYEQDLWGYLKAKESRVWREFRSCFTVKLVKLKGSSSRVSFVEQREREQRACLSEELKCCCRFFILTRCFLVGFNTIWSIKL